MKLRVSLWALLGCATLGVVHAQTWVGGFGGNVFNNASNWSPASVPSANGSLVFGTTTNTNVSFNSLPYTANSLTFTSAATNQFFLNGSGTLTINSGVTTQASSGGANFASSLGIAFGGNQTWSTASTVTANGAVSGAFSLTKTGSGNLILSGSNSYSGGTTVSAGGLYLGQTNSSSGTISVGATGKLGAAYSDVTLSNSLTLTSGATLGGSSQSSDGNMELTGAVGLDSTSHTLNLGSSSDVFLGGAITGSSTALTVAGDGTSIAILAGSLTGVTSVTANNAAVAFGKTATLPTTQIHATGGGYVSVADLDAGVSTPSVSAFMGLITNKAGFNGVLGFDTDEDADHPRVYSDNISLAGFTNGSVRLGSLTSATLTGTITPVAQSYDFGGFAAQGGLLVVKSNLADSGGATSLSLVSPSASGGAPQNGMVLILQGNNSFTGNVSVSDSSLVLDSANALPSARTISLGTNSYAGYTENAGFADFAAFASRVTSSTSTSILGIDSGAFIQAYVDTGTPSTRTVSDAINLSGFSSIYLGSLTGATLTGTITAPTDNTIRLVSMGGESGFVINSTLNQTGGLVVGMVGSEGQVVLNGNNTFSGGTTLQGGSLMVGHNNALSSGTITVNHTTGENLLLGAATSGITLANNIAVTGNLNLGVASQDDNGNYAAGTNTLALTGNISGTGRLYFTAPTTVSGSNSYSGGTYVQADTTVTSNTGLGTGFVDMGYTSSTGSTRAVLSFSGAATAPTIGSLGDAKQFLGTNYGTGDINMAGTVSSLTVNQTSNLAYSGNFTGTAFALVKDGASQLTLLGANAGQFTSTTINAGSLLIGDGGATTTASFSGNVTNSVTGGNTGLFFRPGSAQTMGYSGSITGAGNVTLNGASNATLDVTGGSSNFTGTTTVSSGTLKINGDNLWSSASATTVNTNATLRLEGNQTIKNLNGGGSMNIVTGGKTLTVDSVAGTTFSGVISGSGGLTKTGASQTLTLSANNTFTGATVVSAGTLMVNGAFASSSVTVNSGAFLMGTGTLNDVILNSGGTYSPGLSNSAALVTLDSLTMTSGAILNMQLGGTTYGSQYDALNITNGTSGTGAFNVGSGTLSVTFINGFNPSTGNTFNLFDFTSLTGTFGTLTLQSLTSGLTWDTSLLYTTGVLSVTGTAIPEPATTAAMIGGAVLLLATLRRRRVAA